MPMNRHIRLIADSSVYISLVFVLVTYILLIILFAAIPIISY